MVYDNLIKSSAAKWGIDPELVAAMIMQESAGNCWAMRYEPNFFRKYLQDKPLSLLGGYVPSETKATRITERMLRSCSFGLMQVMGQVARELGFSDDNLTRLLDPEINLYWGTFKLNSLLKARTEKNDADKISHALLRWNGGGDPSYPNKVLAHITSGKIKLLIS